MKRKIICLVVFLFIIVMFKSEAIFASKNNDYNEERSIVRVQIRYTDEGDVEHILSESCGFFIGEDNNKQYVITTYKLQNSLPEQDLGVYLLLDNGVEIPASIFHYNQNMNIAVLSPQKEIGNITYLHLDTNYDYHKSVVYTIDFFSLQEENTAVVKKEGSISDWETRENMHYLKHNIQASNQGSPLIGEDGKVIGINTADSNNGYYYSIEIAEIIEVLDTLGIEYSTNWEVNISELEKVVSEYEAINTEGYSIASVYACEKEYESAKELLQEITDGNTNIDTQLQVDEQVRNLEDAIEALKTEQKTIHPLVIISIIVAGVLLIVVIVLVSLLIIRKKRYQNKIIEMEEQYNMPAARRLRENRVEPNEITESVKQNMPLNRSLSSVLKERSKNSIPKENTEETILLTERELVENNHLHVYSIPYLKRIKTGEIVSINKNSFIIGTSSGHVDYYVIGNNNISRKHACIKKIVDRYYIEDMKTTNGTFVNGQRLQSNCDIPIENGSIIRFADEDFEFGY